MSAIGSVMLREWRHVAGSDRAMFFLYAFLVALWSLLFVGSAAGGGDGAYLVWLVTFSVVVVSNFATGTFMHERLNGALEIALTSGFSRNTIYYGKSFFVTVISFALGGLCLLLAHFWPDILPPELDSGTDIGTSASLLGPVIFFCACYMNAMSAALFSVILPNPRFVFFLNFLISAVIVAVFLAAQTFWNVAPTALVLSLLVPGIAFMEMGRRFFDGERVVRPVAL